MDNNKFNSEAEHQYYVMREAQKQYWKAKDPDMRKILVRVIDNAASKMKESNDPVFVSIAQQIGASEHKQNKSATGGTIVVKLFRILIALLLVGGIGAWIFLGFIQPTARKVKAEKSFLNGQYEECYALLKQNGDTALIKEYKIKEVNNYYLADEYDKGRDAIAKMYADGFLNETEYNNNLNITTYKEAQHYMFIRDFEKAYELYSSLGDYSGAKTQAETAKKNMLKQEYTDAKALLDAGDYEAAYDKLSVLDYEDSAELAKEARYQYALKLYNDGEKTKATEIFEALGSYKDSADYLHTHSFTEVESEKAAGCEEDGEIVKKCECGETQTEVLPATGHDYVKGICKNCKQSDPSYVPSELTGTWNNSNSSSDFAICIRIIDDEKMTIIGPKGVISNYTYTYADKIITYTDGKTEQTITVANINTNMLVIRFDDNHTETFTKK